MRACACGRPPPFRSAQPPISLALDAVDETRLLLGDGLQVLSLSGALPAPAPAKASDEAAGDEPLAAVAKTHPDIAAALAALLRGATPLRDATRLRDTRFAALQGGWAMHPCMYACGDGLAGGQQR